MVGESISDKLDIFLITYNRAKKLDCTLAQLLDEKSPIKEFCINVIDNCSTDNTSDIVKKYQNLHPNLVYKKNKYNIGGNANIANTFLLANKEYIWILCDDDYYSWESWSEVEDAILAKKDAIVVSHIDCPKYNMAQLFAQTSFLPGVIYKTSNYSPEVIANMQFNISNMFPHMSLAAELINKGKEFYITSSQIVKYGFDETGVEKNYTRGYESDLSQLLKNMSYVAGYANILSMIKDKKMRNYFAKKRKFFGPELNSVQLFFQNSKKFNNSFYNLMCIFNCFDFWGKLHFIFNYLMYITVCQIISFYKVESYNPDTNSVSVKCKVRLFFNSVNTNILKYEYSLKGVI